MPGFYDSLVPYHQMNWDPYASSQRAVESFDPVGSYQTAQANAMNAQIKQLQMKQSALDYDRSLNGTPVHLAQIGQILKVFNDPNSPDPIKEAAQSALKSKVKEAFDNLQTPDQFDFVDKSLSQMAPQGGQPYAPESRPGPYAPGMAPLRGPMQAPPSMTPRLASPQGAEVGYPDARKWYEAVQAQNQRSAQAQTPDSQASPLPATVRLWPQDIEILKSQIGAQAIADRYTNRDESNQTIARIRAEAMKAVGAGHDQARIEGAKLSQGRSSTLNDYYRARAQSMMDNVGERAAGMYEKDIWKPYESRIDSADRVAKLIDATQNGSGLVMTDSLKQQIANDLNVLQTQRSTVSGTHAVAIKSLYGWLNGLAGWTSGQPLPTITDAQANQLGTEVGVLRGEIGQQQERKFKSWVISQPAGLKPALVDRYNMSRNQLFSGYGTYVPGQSHSQGPANPLQGYADWSNKNPGRPESIQFFKLHPEMKKGQ